MVYNIANMSTAPVLVARAVLFYTGYIKFHNY
jgi:hypothetical protein